MNSFFALNKYFFSFLAAGFCPKNLGFARKMTALPDSVWAAAPQPPARTPMFISKSGSEKVTDHRLRGSVSTVVTMTS